MNRDVLWSAWDNTAIEYLRLWSDENGFYADSGIVGLIERTPLRLGYRLRCDLDWRVREFYVVMSSTMGKTPIKLELLSDGKGHWQTGTGKPIAALDGCIDVDLMATPFTNTLPIRRLGLGVGDGEEIRVVSVSVPKLEINAMSQRYTYMGIIDGIRRYKYENVTGEPGTALLSVDADGLVLNYPGLFLSRHVPY